MAHSGNSIDGLVLLDKPAGLTSAKALYRVRKLTGQRKSGHAGSLDPFATGVLILCLGKATKIVEQMMDLPKTYLATARLDATTTSLDTETAPEPVAISRIPAREEVERAMLDFEGVILQTPPALSAVKIKGKAAYQWTREGKVVELKPRSVRIDQIRVISYEWPNLVFRVSCGRGTYIRTLAGDLGTRLGVGGYLTALRREAVGPFNLENAHTLDHLESLADRCASTCVTSIETAMTLIRED